MKRAAGMANRFFPSDERGPVIVSVALSVLFHLLIFAAVIFFPDQAKTDRISIPVISVDLVELPVSIEGPVEKEAPKALPKAVKPLKEIHEPEPTPKSPPVVKEKEPVVPPENVKKPPVVVPGEKTYEKKVSMKKKTLNKKVLLKRAISKVAEKVEEGRPSPVDEAIKRIREKSENVDYKKRLLEGIKSRVTVQADQRGEKDGRTAELLLIYKIEIAYKVQQHWAFPDQLVGKKENLKALLVFKVMPDGEIRDIFFTERSGNRYLDESAYRAIVKSNPVHPHPKGVVRPYITVGLRFTPQGIK